MDVYDGLRRDFVMALGKIGIDDNRILDALDEAFRRYRVELREADSADNVGILAAYIECCEYEKMSPGTIENYRLIVGRMLENIGIAVCEIRAADLRTYLKNYQAERGVSDRTINKYREYFRSFFVWCVNEGYCVSNPAAQIRPVRCEKKQKECYTQTELECIRAACSDARDMALIEVLYSTGCRVSELCRLKRSDVDWQNRTVRLFGKGRKERISYLNAKAECYLKWYLESRTDEEEWLFLSKRGSHNLTPAGIQKVLREIKSRIADDFAKPVTPHVFRRTTATAAMQNGMPVEDIQVLLGHEHIETTMAYARTCDENVKHNHRKYIV